MDFTCNINIMKSIQVWDNTEGTGLNYEYDLIQLEDMGNISLRYSAKGWTNPGDICALISDTGEGYNIDLSGKKTIKLDYSQAHELFILLNYLNQVDVEYAEKNVLKSIKVSK
jgi:hypothetical protein